MRRIAVALTLLVGLGSGLGLAGCAAGESYPPATARELQSGVRDVAATAATQDYAGAIARLDALQARSDAAEKRGDLSHDRYLAVARSIAGVRADLTRLQAAAEQARLQQQLEQQQAQQQQQQAHEKPKDDKGHGDHGH